MLADKIAWFLKFSPSGARKYIRDLREAGVIELARYIEGTATYLGKAVYQADPGRRTRGHLPGSDRPAQTRWRRRRARSVRACASRAWRAMAATSISWPTTPTMPSASIAARFSAIHWWQPCSAPRRRCKRRCPEQATVLSFHCMAC